MSLKYRMYEKPDGAVVEAASEIPGVGDMRRLCWVYVAQFKETPEAERCYPDAKFLPYCEHCEEPFYGESESCPKCCEHGDYDHGICGLCGEDCTDDLVGAAESAFEGER